MNPTQICIGYRASLSVPPQNSKAEVLNARDRSFLSMSAARITERKRKAFSAEEDDRLRELVSRLGDTNWRAIAGKMPRRSRRQCRERWSNYLSPTVCNGTWSLWEDDMLRSKVHEHGRKWRTIQAFFPGRTDVNIKNHWKTMQRVEARKEKLDALEDPVPQSTFEIWNGTCAHDKAEGRPLNGATDPDSSWLFWFDR
jgi:hypothetical protein